MARSPLARGLGEAASVASEAAAREISAGEVLDERARLRRRELLAGGAGLAVAAMLSGRLSRAIAAEGPRVVVVGGGLAGLTCAYRLKQSGHRASLYEASDRLGGRCWTRRGDFAAGQIAEHGGELIDQGHTQTRQLVQQLGLNLDNLLSAEVNGTDPFYYFDGKPYSYAEATDDLKQIWQQLHSDVSAASYPTLYNLSTERGRQLDNMSITDYIKAYVPGGLRSRLGQLLDVAYTIEYGGESSVQSSLNMLYLIAYSGQGQLRIFGPSNEKYHVVGGNDQITDRLASALSGQITMGSRLVAVRRNSTGTWTLSFRQGLTTRDVTADRVVLALPFSILRSSVDLKRAGFPPLKMTAINEQGMGTNSKLHVGFKTRLWTSLGSNGETFADTGYQNSWEVTRGQAGTTGILVNYTGGNYGATFGSGTPASRAQQFLTQVEPVLPGITQKWNGKASIDYWQGYRWTKGSYSYWKVGQYTKFSGIERERQGNCHFAGEHTSVDFQGYLNGAVETGARAAAEILGDLKKA